MIRLTPKGRVVRALTAEISVESSSGVIDPDAMTPKPPAFEIAETKFRSETQVIAPPIMANSLPSIARPDAQSRSRWARYPQVPPSASSVRSAASA